MKSKDLPKSESFLLSKERNILPEIKEKNKDEMKLVGFFSKKAYFKDANNKPWYLDLNENMWREAELMDMHPFNTQFDVEIPFDQINFKNKEEAFMYTRYQLFKHEARQEAEDLKQIVAGKKYNKEIMNDAEKLLPWYEKIIELISEAEREVDFQKRSALEANAFKIYESGK